MRRETQTFVRTRSVDSDAKRFDRNNIEEKLQTNKKKQLLLGHLDNKTIFHEIV